MTITCMHLLPPCSLEEPQSLKLKLHSSTLLVYVDDVHLIDTGKSTSICLLYVFFWALQEQSGLRLLQQNAMNSMVFTCQRLYVQMWNQYHRMIYCYFQTKRQLFICILLIILVPQKASSPVKYIFHFEKTKPLLLGSLGIQAIFFIPRFFCPFFLGFDNFLLLEVTISNLQ